jgi:hypothetical protein
MTPASRGSLINSEAEDFFLRPSPANEDKESFRLPGRHSVDYGLAWPRLALLRMHRDWLNL